MKTIMATILFIALFAAPAAALEDGVTFNGDGTCYEADGAPGMSMADGECVTATDYDKLFSYDALSQVATQDPFDGDTTVAERYSITPGSPPASTRLIGVGLVDVPFTFRQVLRNVLL